MGDDTAMCSGFGTLGTLWPDYLKPDQEPATVDVLREIANLRGSRGILLEHSPVADSRGMSVENDKSASF